MIWIFAILLTLLIYQLSVFSTTIFLHRSAAHRAVALHPAVAALMRTELWLFTGIVTREWVAVHRKHHHFTDEHGDPHSPHIEGVWPILLANAWYYGREARKPETVAKYAKDIPHGWGDALLDHGWMGILSGLTLCSAIFYLPTHSIGHSVLFGGCCFAAQAVLYVVASALINGACHAFGYKNFANTATNLRWVAWLSGGEGLHNNHHNAPANAKFSVRADESDFAWPVIKLMQRLSLAKVAGATGK